MKTINNEIRVLTLQQREEILVALKQRFEQTLTRHKDIDWSVVLERLEARPEKLWSLNEME